MQELRLSEFDQEKNYANKDITHSNQYDSKNIIEQQNMFVLVNPFAAHANIKIFEKFYKRKKIKKQFQYNSLDNKIYLDEKDLKNTLSNLSLDKI